MLTSTCLGGNLELLYYLVLCGLTLEDAWIFGCFQNLIRRQDIKSEMIEALLLQINDPNFHFDGVSFLHLICFRACPRSTRYLLDRGADRNALDGVALLVASYVGQLDVVRMLIEYKVGEKIPISKVSDALLLSCECGHVEVAAYLIERGADVNVYTELGVSPLAYAVSDGRADIVELLVKTNSLAHTNDRNGLSLLLIACQNGHEAIVKVLLDHAADPNVVDGQGFGCLYRACTKYSIMQVLLEYGADPNLRSRRSEAPFLRVDLASIGGYHSCECVASMLDYGANVNLAYARTGDTALMWAASNGHIDLV